MWRSWLGWEGEDVWFQAEGKAHRKNPEACKKGRCLQVVVRSHGVRRDVGGCSPGPVTGLCAAQRGAHERSSGRCGKLTVTSGNAWFHISVLTQPLGQINETFLALT